jgi:NhaA family Na+:H+ antiporter
MAILGGIGFTMSLFIGGLAFAEAPALVDRVKLGVIAGSVVSALAGAVLMTRTFRPPEDILAVDVAGRTELAPVADAGPHRT